MPQGDLLKRPVWIWPQQPQNAAPLIVASPEFVAVETREMNSARVATDNQEIRTTSCANTSASRE